MLDRYLAPHTPEAQAHFYIKENIHWEDGHHSMNETLIALCASYAAFARYVDGADIYFMPRSTSELESMLRRYAYDAIHNTIAQSKSTLELGGYSRVCHLAEQSIRAVLRTGNNAADLLSMHQQSQPVDISTVDSEDTSARILNMT